MVALNESYVTKPNISFVVFSGDEVIIDSKYSKDNDIGFVTSVSMLNSITAIPSVEVTLSCGLDTATVTKAGPAYHSLLRDAIENRLGVGLYLSQEEQKVKSWSDSVKPEMTCIFKGYIAKHTFQRTESSVSYSLTLIHWISDLSLLNLLSPMSHPENPADVALAGYFNVRAPESTEVVSDVPQWLPATKCIESLDQEGCLPKALCICMKTALENINENVKRGVNKRIYNRVIAAIDHLKTNLVTYHSDVSEHATKAKIPAGIRHSLATSGTRELTNTTAWDLITQKWLPLYNMDLVIGVSNAWFIPAPICIFDYARSDKWVDIPLRKIISVTREHAVNPVVGAVVLYHPAAAAADTAISLGSPFTLSYPEEFREGPVLSAQLPSWLTLSFEGAAYSESRMSILSKCNVSLEDETSDTYTSEEQQDAQDTEIAQNSCIAIAKRYVKQLYLQRVVQYRKVTVTTPARFDITPGSIVHIECPPDKLVQENLSSDIGYQPALIGVVVSVEISYPVAGAPTSKYTLGYVRDETEVSGVFSNKEPVFFADYFCNKEHSIYLSED